MTDEERVAVSEVIACADLAVQSTNPAVQAMGLIHVERALRILEGKTKLFRRTDKEIDEWVSMIIAANRRARKKQRKRA